MRIHLGHHFYGAGNVGDDFMLAGFLAATRRLGIGATFTSCVPFDRVQLTEWFPEIQWLPYEPGHRANCIEACDAWLGLGGSPFQSAQSRWFVDHLLDDAAVCHRHKVPMFYLGVGLQSSEDVGEPDVQTICQQAAGIWTRNASSAERLATACQHPSIRVGSDLAHILFEDCAPQHARAGRLAVTPNFDYGNWPGLAAFLQFADAVSCHERVWLVQERRRLPGAEIDLFERLPADVKARWRLLTPALAHKSIREFAADWPAGELTVTARHHAAIAAAWAGARIVVIDTNEKLRATADELGAPLVSKSASLAELSAAAASAPAPRPPGHLAAAAMTACKEFWDRAVLQKRT